MVMVSEIRKMKVAGWFDLKKGYFRHFSLEMRLSFQTLKTWVFGWRRFRHVYQTIERAPYVRL